MTEIKWTKRYGYFLIGIIVAAIAIYGISYLSIVKPLQHQLETVKQEANMFEVQVERIRMQDDNETDQLGELTTLIPNGKAPETVLLSMEELAARTNVTISSIQSSGETLDMEENGVLGTVIYSMEVGAEQLSQVNAFLEAIEDSNRYILIQTMSVFQNDLGSALSVTFASFYTNY